MSRDEMRAIRIYGAEDVRLESIPVPTPGPDEVLLEVTGAGVCGTDAALYRHGVSIVPGAEHTARWPIVLGHEFSGRVVEVGAAVSGVKAGDLVASGGGVSCGGCVQCRAGRTNLCQNYWTAGIHRDGGLAEFCAVPGTICEPTGPHGVDGDAVGLAQPMAIAVHSIRQGNLVAGERALVIGVGGVGAFATWAASQFGAEVTICDRDPERLAVAADLGAAHSVLATGAPLLELLAESGPWDVVYEMTGAEEPLLAALELVSAGGRVVAAGIQGSPRALDVAKITAREITLLGPSAHVCAVDLPVALDLLGARQESWADVAPRVFSLDDIEGEALPALVRGQLTQTKALADPSATSSRDFGT